MREVKFCAWDRLCKRYWYSGFSIKDGKVVNLSKEIQQARITAGWTIDKSYTDICGFDIEQCTGLKDKNGRDVYEGDILLTDTSWHVIVRWIDESSKDMGNPRCGWNIHRGSWLDKCEVIGNIHEDSELLEEK